MCNLDGNSPDDPVNLSVPPRETCERTDEPSVVHPARLNACMRFFPSIVPSVQGLLGYTARGCASRVAAAYTSRLAIGDIRTAEFGKIEGKKKTAEIKVSSSARQFDNICDGVINNYCLFPHDVKLIDERPVKLGKV